MNAYSNLEKWTLPLDDGSGRSFGGPIQISGDIIAAGGLSLRHPKKSVEE